MRKLSEAMEIFITLIVMIVSWADAYVPTHQTVSIKYVQVLAYRLYCNKVGLFCNGSCLERQVTLEAVLSMSWVVDGCGNHGEFLQCSKMHLQFDIKI